MPELLSQDKIFKHLSAQTYLYQLKTYLFHKSFPP